MGGAATGGGRAWGDRKGVPFLTSHSNLPANERHARTGAELMKSLAALHNRRHAASSTSSSSLLSSFPGFADVNCGGHTGTGSVLVLNLQTALLFRKFSLASRQSYLYK